MAGEATGNRGPATAGDRRGDDVGEATVGVEDDVMPGADDAVVEAIGKASEALEYVERARGHLYSLHQLIGHADLVFGEAADQLAEAGLDADAARLATEIVGRNVLDGRWTYQIVEEFDRQYWSVVTEAVRRLERDHLDGRRHVFEARLKEERRTLGRRGHEARPPAANDPDVVT